MDFDGKIIGSQSPDPVLSLTNEEVSRFQNQVQIIDKIGEDDMSNLGQEISGKN